MSFAAFGMGALDRLVGNLSDTYGTGNTLRDDKREEARDDYIFNEREGIRARVEGAKSAGLHPLAALGFQAGAPATQVSGSDPIQSSGYAGYSDPAPAGKSDPSLERINAANARRAEAEADMAELNAHNAYRALATQPGNPPAGSAMPTDPANQVGSQRGGIKPGVVIKPDEVISGMNGFTSGTHQAATAFRLPGGYKLNVPSGDFASQTEDMSLLKYYLMYLANRDSLSTFFRDDVPLAAKGYWNDYSNAVKKKLSYRGKSAPRKSGGATGSW